MSCMLGVQCKLLETSTNEEELQVDDHNVEVESDNEVESEYNIIEEDPENECVDMDTSFHLDTENETESECSGSEFEGEDFVTEKRCML